MEGGMAVSNPAAEANEQSNGVNKIFGNSVIFGIIGDHLGIPDLKILRQTCKLLLNKVNGHVGFLPNLTLTITDETIQEIQLSSLGWKSAKLIIDKISPRNFPLIPTTSLIDLQLIRSVDLLDYTESDTIKSSKTEAMRRSACYNFLKSAVFTSLESLTIDLTLFHFNIPQNLLKSTETVKALTFVGGVGDSNEEGGGSNGSDGSDPEETRHYRELKWGSFKKNLKIFGNLKWKLTSLTARADPLFQRYTDETFGKILTSNSNTIEKIEVAFHDFAALKELHGLQFPQLRELKLKIGMLSCSQFAGWLNHQLPLESMDIRVCWLGRSGDAELPFLEAVKTNATNPKLHTLVIKGNKIFRAWPNAESWRFIQGLKGLKKFKIPASYPSDYTDMGILNNLPVSLQSLALFDHLRAGANSRGLVMSSLRGFSQLTHLKIESRILFNDQMLQFICEGLIRLRSFNFCCEDISDFGLTGERDPSAGTPNSGISLRNLKGLRGLEIKGNPPKDRMTEQGLVKAIQFLELRSLVFSRDIPIPDAALKEMASNNPSLEFVRRNVVGKESDFDERELFSSLLSINPRLTRICTYYTGGGGWSGKDVSARPSYGVPSRILDESATRRVREAMKLAYPPDSGATCYYYKL